MKHDTHYTLPVIDLQKAVDLVRTHGGLMVTRNSEGGVSYGTPCGDVLHARTAKEMITRGMVKPVGTDLFGNGEPQLYEAVIQ